MTKSGVIQLSNIKNIRIYFNTKRRACTKTNLQRILREEDGDLIMNAAIFLHSGNPCCHLKVNGKVKYAPDYTAWAIAWTKPTDFCVMSVPTAEKENWMECVHAIIDGKKIDKMNYGEDMEYSTHRTAVGTKNGCFAYFATQDKLSPEELRERLWEKGWDNAIMMDGGGSSCIMDKKGNGFAGDGRVIPFFLIVTMKEQDNEPKGEKPVVEINAYSKTKDGSKYLTKNFQVKEFACKDGSDTIFIAQKLPMVLQYIRARTGKAFTPNRAYSTPEHNESVGGATYSQHLYGTAADIPTVSGYTPAQMALIAREIMHNWGGVGIYKWGIHVDVREEKADWNG